MGPSPAHVFTILSAAIKPPYLVLLLIRQQSCVSHHEASAVDGTLLCGVDMCLWFNMACTLPLHSPPAMYEATVWRSNLTFC